MSQLKISTLADLENIKRAFKESKQNYKKTVRVCGGAGCISSDCAAVSTAFNKVVAERKLEGEFYLVETGCIGMCALGPLVVIEPDGVLYVKVTAEKMEEIIDKHLIGGSVVEAYTYVDPRSNKHIPQISEIDFFSKQVKIALRNCGRIPYGSIEAYIANDGYFAMAKALNELKREGVIEVLKASGLRGRGGAGFPAGVKWESGYKAKGDIKYMVCNGDEGDPGAFMDRSILEGDPHSIIEAMMLGGYTIGAKKGYFYVRAEYPVAVERLNSAIDEARAFGLLGENILGSDFSFDLEVRIGAGAFVCGEETALLNSIEGKRGEPRQKPPFPFQRGLFGYPTIINNVETLANIPAIIVKGAEWYASYGVGKSKGTKVFALAGDIVNAGIVEIPMGMKMREVIYDIGGGMTGGKAFKAVQSGGPSGGCLTADHLDVSVDYESLSAMGAIMGSGGLIAMDENTCLVDTARYFMEFGQDESCGHCLPCRVGTKRILEILQRIVRGKGVAEDIETLSTLSKTICDTAMCGLGQTAPNPVLTTLKYFRDEYEAHIHDKRCPAHVCTALKRYLIDEKACVGCTICAKNCPTNAISGSVKKPHFIDQEACIRCGVCMEKCKFNAISVQY
ncbi:MAG: NADH-ubiquinone oxidoreductase-F iron-sulfur binding region domain-containing protein [Bradymonadia bacterium]|jgi:NADH-quinone oxidoreductase subunit F